MTPDNVIPFPRRPDPERTAEKMLSDKEVMALIVSPFLPEGMEDFFEDDDGPENAA